MTFRRVGLLLAALLVLALSLACVATLPAEKAGTPGATPVLPEGTTATAAPTPAPLPTLAQATATPVSSPQPAPSPAAMSTPQADGTMTLLLTEKDLEDSVASPAVQQQIQTDNFRARFRDGKVLLSVDALRYGLIGLGHVEIEGTITASDGVAHLNAERIEPNNMITAAIPGVLEQYLTASAAEWYVEDVTVGEGTIVYTVRPRG